MEKDFLGLLESYMDYGGSGAVLADIWREHFDLADGRSFYRLAELAEGLKEAVDRISSSRDAL